MSDRELVYLVDDDDKVVGKKWRDDLTRDDCWRAVSIWITDSNGRILLQQRSKNKANGPGLWTFAAEGTVQYGDDYDPTAYKELEEELGISGQDLIKCQKVLVRHEEFFGSRIFQCYRLTLDMPIEDMVLQESEVEQVQWFTPEEFEDELARDPKKFSIHTFQWHEMFEPLT